MTIKQATSATKPVTIDASNRVQSIPKDVSIKVLESRYQRILSVIQSMWGHKELNQYFKKLMISDRGPREGFPPDAWMEINTLMNVHHAIVPPSRF